MSPIVARAMMKDPEQRAALLMPTSPRGTSPPHHGTSAGCAAAASASHPTVGAVEAEATHTAQRRDLGNVFRR
jgi:hypothetical protein